MPSLFEAVGGHDGLYRLAEAWHERVLADEVVSHAFSHGFHPQHTERLAAYWGEALGGPADFSERYGDESSVVRMHSGNGAHEEMDRRAIACFEAALHDVGLTSDARLAGALRDYFAWATTTTHGSLPVVGRRRTRRHDDPPVDLGRPRRLSVGRAQEPVRSVAAQSARARRRLAMRTPTARLTTPTTSGTTPEPSPPALTTSPPAVATAPHTRYVHIRRRDGGSRTASANDGPRGSGASSSPGSAGGLQARDTSGGSTSPYKGSGLVRGSASSQNRSTTSASAVVATPGARASTTSRSSCQASRTPGTRGQHVDGAVHERRVRARRDVAEPELDVGAVAARGHATDVVEGLLIVEHPEQSVHAAIIDVAGRALKVTGTSHPRGPVQTPGQAGDRRFSHAMICR